MKEFVICKVLSVEPATLLENEHLHNYYLRILSKNLEYLFHRTTDNGYFLMFLKANFSTSHQIKVIQRMCKKCGNKVIYGKVF